MGECIGITPDFRRFEELAALGNLVPLRGEIIADLETPVTAYHKLTSGGDGWDKYSFMLESVEGGENVARYSFLGCRPRAVLTQTSGKAELLLPDGSRTPIAGKDAFARIQNVIKSYRPVEVEGMPPFAGGAVGYVGYDAVDEIEPTAPRPANDPLPDVPEAFFMITDTLLAFDRVDRTIKIINHAHIDGATPLRRVYDEAAAKINAAAAALRRPLTLPPVEVPRDTPADIAVASNKSRGEFHAMVERAKRYIVDGDIIQAVLSQRFQADCLVSPLALHRSLRTVNPSPYMFLLECGGFSLVGASPEIHARCQDGLVTVRPIAGTRPRGGDKLADIELERELLADPKERAEHIMLVDLARNDIGRVAETGSVVVEDLMTVERYSHVMHIVSSVTGKLRRELAADAVMSSTFPAGTLTGAPKVRAMQIISELEGECRGPYGGAVAYYSFNGNVDSCITIRTALLKDGKAYFQAGGGVVADSSPEGEYQESCNKAKAMLKALSLAERFEPQAHER